MKLEKGMKICDNSMKIARKFSRSRYGVICRCGKKYKMSPKEIRKNVSPCSCKYSNKSLVIQRPQDMDTESNKKLSKKQELKMLDLDSVFKTEVAGIQSLLVSHDTDGAILTFQKKSLSMLMELIPVAEHSYRTKYGGGSTQLAYSLNSLISQARELIADLHAERDHSELASRLSTSIVNPAFLNIAQNIINNLHSLKKRTEPYIVDGKALTVSAMVDEATKDIGKFIEDSYIDINIRIIKEMDK